MVVLSTLAIDDFRCLEELGRARGVPVLDCGVARGDLAAENGLVAMLGGEFAAVDHARPVLESWAKQVLHCGGSGTGMATKIARNAVTFGMWRVLEEAAAITEAAGHPSSGCSRRSGRRIRTGSSGVPHSGVTARWPASL